MVNYLSFLFINKLSKLQGVQKKMCFFTIQCNPSLAYIIVQRNASVQSLLLAGNFFVYNQEQPSAGDGEVANFGEFLGKTQYIMNTLYKMLEPGQSLTLAKTTRSERIEKLEFATVCLSVLCLN